MARREATEEDFLMCYICYDVFKEPKTLTCLHRFCEQCLHRYIIAQKSQVLIRQSGFQCPVCREMIKAPNAKRPPSDWASLLKTDFYLNSLIRYIEKNGGAPSGTKTPQHPCSKHKDKESDLFCADCQQIICHQCAGISHRSCNQVVTVAEAAVNRRAATEIWLKKLMKVMSESVSIDQAREKSMDNLEKQMAKAEEAIKVVSKEWLLAIRKEEVRLLQNLNKQYQTMTDAIAHQLIQYDDKITKTKENIKNISSNENSLSDYDILKMADMTESETMKEGGSTLSAYKSLVERIQGINIEFHRSPKPGVEIGSLIVQKHNEPSETSFKTSKTLEVSTDRQGTVVYDLDLSGSVVYSKGSSYKPPVTPKRPKESSFLDATASRFRDTLSKVLPKKTLTSRQFQNENTPERQPSISSNATAESSTERNTHSAYNARDTHNTHNTHGGADESDGGETSEANPLVREVRSINAVFREDYTSPKLRDVLVAGPGHTILVTDWANHCVKAFFVRRDKDCRLTVGGKPWAITQLGPSLAAVSLPLARQICVLKITSPLMVQKSFQVSKNYSGLATFNSETLVASGGSDPPSVDIINLFGEVLKSFSTNEQGNPLFIYPAYVSVTPSSEILVSDKKRGALICLDHTGKVRFEFNPQGPKRLQEPSGIVSMRSGHILLLELRGLLKLTPRGQLERPLMRQEDSQMAIPKGVALDSDDLIYITANEEVTVFDVVT